MILLETGNRILGETVAAQLKAPEVVQNDEGQDVKGVRLPIDVRLCDFDDVSYRVVIDAAALGVMKVSIALPCWGTIEANGGAAARDRIYGDLVQNPPEAGFDVTLALPLDGAALPNGESAQSLSDKVARIKTNLIGGAFDHHFQALLDGKAGTTATKFNPRSDTTVFFFPRADRVTVVFSLEFSERVDAAIAKVFMQEFVDAKRRIAAAPPCTFGVNPPLELKEFGITEPTGNLGFISFAVLKSHLEQGRKQKVIDVLAPFRTYLQYHLKCSKSYFHSRMRARVVSLLKMLNRAKVEQPDDKKEKKTMAGKTFIRSS